MDKTGTLDVLIIHDDHEAENDAFYIKALDTGMHDVNLDLTRGATDRTTLDVVIEDDEDQKVVIQNERYSSGPTNLYEPAGDPGIDSSPQFRILASPARVDLPLEVRLDMVDLQGQTVSAAQISLGAASVNLNSNRDGDSDEWVDVNLPDSDRNRMNDDYKLTASVNATSVATGGYETISVTEHAITVIDRHKLPTLSVSPMEDTVMEGEKTELTLTIDRNPHDTYVGAPAINSGDSEKRQYTSEEVSVMLDMGAGSTVDTSDYSIMVDGMMMNSVTIPEHNGRAPWRQTATVEVMATDDDVIDDMEMLVLDAEMTGAMAMYESMTYEMVSALTITNGTDALVWAKSPDEIKAAVMAAKGADPINPGDMFEVMGSALFNAAPGVTVDYTADSGDMGVASTSVTNGTVMVTANSAGEAYITVTAHASMPTGAVMIADQTNPRKASVSFPVHVMLDDLSIMLSGPEDMNLVEGMSYEIKAMANRAVTEDTMVELVQTEGTASPSDYTVGNITIMAGEMMGSTTLMIADDGMMENENNMSEMLALEGRVGAMKTNALHFYLWDAAVPALPIIAQLLLAAFLALGGYRRYLRR